MLSEAREEETTHFPEDKSQVVPTTQSFVDPHEGRQVSPTHLYGVQSFVVPFAAFTECSPSHVAPLRHLPLGASQLLPAAQSASDSHAVLQLEAPHAYGAQFVVTRSSQIPLPVHLAGSVCTPSTQLAARHETAGPTWPAHTPRFVPSQLPAEHGSLAVPAAHLARAPCGESATGTQSPIAAGTSQASQAPEHGALQQTPSTQRPESHSPDARQAAPSLLRQCPGADGIPHD